MISYLVTTIDGESLSDAKDDLTIRRWAEQTPYVTEVRRGQTNVYRRLPDGPRVQRHSE
jgi:hypothetical protein